MIGLICFKVVAHHEDLLSQATGIETLDGNLLLVLLLWCHFRVLNFKLTTSTDYQRVCQPTIHVAFGLASDFFGIDHAMYLVH